MCANSTGICEFDESTDSFQIVREH
jgi:hypothetical protein